MSKTKEMWESAEPVNPQELKDYRDFTKDFNTYPRMTKEDELQVIKQIEEEYETI